MAISFRFSDAFVAKWRILLNFFLVFNSLLVLILLGAASSQTNSTWGSAAFGIFTCVITFLWTLSIVGQHIYYSRNSTARNSPSGFLRIVSVTDMTGLDLAVTLILCVFWLAAAASVARDVNGLFGCGFFSFCKTFQAAAAFLFFGWFAYLFMFYLLAQQFYYTRYTIGGTLPR